LNKVNFVNRTKRFKARDIGAGANGSVWAIGSNYKVYQYIRNQIRCKGDIWEKARNRYGIRLAVGPTGAPWVINNRGKISTLIKNEDSGSSSWTNIPGSAKDIGVGLDGSVWIINKRRRSGGYQVAKMQINRRGRVSW
jgi:hypothetical protein